MYCNQARSGQAVSPSPYFVRPALHARTWPRGPPPPPPPAVVPLPHLRRPRARARPRRRNPLLLFLLAVLATVALYTVLPRLRAIVAQIVVPRPPFTFSSPSRPITTSSMASGKLKTPPQAPPLFTHTPESLITNTEKLLARGASR